MKTYRGELTLNKNSRGCYILDTVKGCNTCLKTYPNGCYGSCYAKNIAGRYGFNFSKSVDREFTQDNRQLYLYGFYDTSHINHIRRLIKKCPMPFVRIGEMGDPSENWEHTINVCKEIYDCGKTIVIITKHWKTLSDKVLGDVAALNLCINTSISALDTESEIAHRLAQFNRLKPFCKAVLRIVSCDFNKENKDGLKRSLIQDVLFQHTPNIDTAFRPSDKSTALKDGIILAQRAKFLSANMLVSKFRNYVYLGGCKDCPDMCGINF